MRQSTPTPTISVMPQRERHGWYAIVRCPNCNRSHRHTLGYGDTPKGGYHDCHIVDQDWASAGYIIVIKDFIGGTR